MTVEPRISRSVISTHETQNIAERVMNLDEAGSQNAASETIAIHPVFHEILQIRMTKHSPWPPTGTGAEAYVPLTGWIEGMRSAFEFFALDVLLLHAEALLRVLDEREPLSSLSEQHNRMYRYCKSMLQLEIGSATWHAVT